MLTKNPVKLFQSFPSDYFSGVGTGPAMWPVYFTFKLAVWRAFITRISCTS
jgi:hypothetical protein